MPSYMERKFRSLNCMGKNRKYTYGSIDSIDSYADVKSTNEQSNIDHENSANNVKRFKLLKSLPLFRTHKGQTYRGEYNHKTERTRLISESDRIKYSLISDEIDGSSRKSSKKSVRFADSVKEEKINSANGGGAGGGGNKKMNKKKKSLLKRTGGLLVRSCRLMTYGAPYMHPNFPYSNRYPPSKYTNYDFETGKYDYGTQYAYYGEYYPTMYF